MQHFHATDSTVLVTDCRYGVQKMCGHNLQDIHVQRRLGVKYVNKYNYDHNQYRFTPPQNWKCTDDEPPQREDW
jgi:hypothetical protein